MAKWLVKTEPSECSINDFAKQSDTCTPWDGVRNYQARNFLRQMAEGDLVLIYHSSCKNIGIAGVVQVTRSAYADPTQFDPESPYHDPKSTQEQPRWQAVDMQFKEKLAQLISLDRLKNTAGLEALPLVRKGNRLSVMPVSENEWQIIRSLQCD